MLEIESLVVDRAVRVYRTADAFEKRDRHLADQLKRSAKSVSQNLSEASGAYRGNKQRAFRIALAERRESLTSLEIARRLGLARAVAEQDRAIANQIVGTLVGLAYPP
ncbi:MAG: four helix bundle protein [Planctomycetota bacterium]|jgi:four helix bundle protein